MRATACSRPVPRAGRRVTAILALAAVAVLGAGSPAGAYDLSTSAYTAVLGGDISYAYTVAPGGLGVAVYAAGDNVGLTGVADTLNTSAPTSGMFTPAVALTTPSVRVSTRTGTETSPPCAADGPCPGRGLMAIFFSRPVTNPTLHLAGIGEDVSEVSDGSVVAQSQVSTVLRLLGSQPAGATLDAASAGATNLSATQTQIGATDQSAAPECGSIQIAGSPTPYPAAATAACGSVRILGTVQVVAFTVDAVFVPTATSTTAASATAASATVHGATVHGATDNAGYNGVGSGDEFSIAVSVPQDFGDAPASYDEGQAASADLSDLRLGDTVGEDNAAVADGTASPNAGATAADDEGDDGVVLGPLAQDQTSYSATVAITGASEDGEVCGWIDFDRSGTFSDAERACADVVSEQTSATLTWSGITGLSVGDTYARFRISYNQIQIGPESDPALAPTGPIASGEVEDYRLPIGSALPVAAPDVDKTPYRTPVTTLVLANDAPGSEATLVPSSLRLVGNRCPSLGRVSLSAWTYGRRTAALANFGLRPTGAVSRRSPRIKGHGLGARSCLQAQRPSLVTTLVTDAGTYTANAGGWLTFAPADDVSGPAPAVTYSIADSNEDRATATYTVTVGAAPLALPDTADTGQNTPVGVDVVANDTPGDDGAGHPGTLDPPSLRLLDPTSDAPVTVVTVPGVGTYTVNAAGVVTLTPVADFSGRAAAVGYRITDSFGNTAVSTVTVTVGAVVPVAGPDTATTRQATLVRTDVLANDTPGAPRVPLVPASVRLVRPGTRLLVGTLVTAQGSYVANPDGTVSFTPAPAFTGTAPPAGYSVADGNGTRARSTYTVTVRADPPAASDDQVTTRPGEPVRIPVLGNDSGGSAGLDPTTVRLIDPGSGLPVTTVAVTGVGTWAVNQDGSLTFTPAAGFRGEASIGYQVTDLLGRANRAGAGVTVRAGGRLPRTGSDLGLAAGAGGLGVLLGGLVLLAGYRRQEPGCR